VLRRRADVRAYGSVLLEVGRRASRTRLAAAAFAEPVSSLERRIRIMTAPRVRRPLLRAAASGALSALLVAAACEAPQPTQPPVARRIFDKSALTPKAAVADFFPAVATQGTAKDDILLFVVSAEGDVVQRAWIRGAPDPTTPVRGAGDARLRPLIEPYKGKVARVQLVEFRPGEVGPTETRVVWAQLRPAPGTAPDDPRSIALRDAIRRHYPPRLRDAGITARVGVSFTVGADGKAGEVSVVGDEMDSAFVDAARAVVADLTFPPGKPGEGVVMTISFAPERTPAPDAR
jgi:protein TonB